MISQQERAGCSDDAVSSASNAISRYSLRYLSWLFPNIDRRSTLSHVSRLTSPAEENPTNT